jgi:FGGY-family pentulose kinase/HAD superfamily hydrolase (TIGR01509 family)
MGEAYIGVDVGTGSARAGVFDAFGRLIASARRPISTWRERGEIVEQSSEDIWRAVCLAVRDAVLASGEPSESFGGLGFDATCSLVVVDPNGRPLSVGPSNDPARNVIVWMDHRASAEAERINVGGHEVLRYVGGRISPEMQTPKLAWLSARKPETFASAGHFFDLADYLSWRSTGSLQRSLCTVACKFAYLAHERRWDGDFLESVGLGDLRARDFARIGAEVVAAGQPLGRGLTAEAGAALGLPPGLPVGAGLIDAHAGALGTIGARSQSGEAPDPLRRLAVILGTSACCMALAERPIFIDGVWGPSFGAVTPDQWLTEGGQSAFGAAIDQLLRLHPAFAGFAGQASGSAIEALERGLVRRARGLSEAALLAESLHVLPEFLGNRSPFADPAARAAIVGLDLRDDLESLQELHAGGLCGLAYGVADVIGVLERGGYAFDMIVVSGGAARSALVRQIVADATGKTVYAPQTPEPVLLGSAMIGAVAAGRWTIAEAMTAMSELAQPMRPVGGAIAAFHVRKRRAFEILQRAERDLRAQMRSAAPIEMSAGAKAWPEVVVFDCDGVLVDSEVLALGVTRRALGEAGLHLSDEETRRRFLGLRLDSLISKVEAELGSPLPAEFSDALSRGILASFSRELKGIAGVRQAVEGLEARVCVASSSSPERLQLALRVCGYETLFAPNIFSAAAVARGKPSPDLFLYAARSMGARAQDCLVIEDSVAGVSAARAAGMAVFGFVGGSHFLHLAQGESLTAAGAALIFDDMAQLPKIVAARWGAAKA